MKTKTIILLALVLSLPILACSLSLLEVPTSLPFLLPSQTAPGGTPQPPTLTPSAPGASPTPEIPTSLPPTVTTAGILPGSPSGPYAVVLVLPGDILNIRSAPGAANPVVGSFPPGATNVMRLGPSASADGALWVQVTNPSGGSGWVNSHFLTEAVSPADFCASPAIGPLLTGFGSALLTENGEQLASLISPTHGLDVRLWRYASVINFDREHSRWIFASTYAHNWGPDGASGLDTVGSFREAVLPRLQEVFGMSYTPGCNEPSHAASFSLQPWPEEYAAINYYSVLKPGTPGIDLDFRIFLVGVEFVQGQPYVFSLIHFQWEP